MCKFLLSKIADNETIMIEILINFSGNVFVCH